MALAPLIKDLTLILGVAGAVTFIFRRIKQPVILGYLLAGFLVKPHFYEAKSADVSGIQVWSELGIIFLMFSLGLEFSFRRLFKAGGAIIFAQVFQLIGMISLGIAVGNFWGWTRVECLFLGCTLAISSTSIIVKTIEEFNLKDRKFVDLVYGILILQDLAAIVILVILTNISGSSSGHLGTTALYTIGKLLVVVSIWFVVGMIFVPKLIKSVKDHGSEETLTIVSIGLCLILVTIAANFGYSAALGAFIMGAILGESPHSHQITKVVAPLKNLFAAIFFVGIGMIIDLEGIKTNIFEIIIISSLVIFGNFIFVSIGLLVSGQSLGTSLPAALSLGQIGEFSFIIAALGAAQKMVSPAFYPVIVGVSTITSFISPLLMKSSYSIAEFIINILPDSFHHKLNLYSSKIQHHSIKYYERKGLYRGLLKWSLNGVLVATVFTLSSDYLIAKISSYEYLVEYSAMMAWIFAFLISSPSLGAMFYTFDHLNKDFPMKSFSKDAALICGNIATVGFIGLLSIGFFPAYLTIMVTIVVCIAYIFIFRSRIEKSYRWLEGQFSANFRDSNTENNQHNLAPWDAHLVEFLVHHKSFLIGRSIVDLQIRENYGFSIVVIKRGESFLVAPGPRELIYPGDILFGFGTDGEVEKFKTMLASEIRKNVEISENFELKKIVLSAESFLVGKTIKDSKIREQYGSIVVGIERENKRIKNPKPDIMLMNRDILWVVGSQNGVKLLDRDLQ